MPSGKYGYEHQRLRASLIAAAVGQLCILCHRLMLPGQPLDLDHTSDGRGYRGIVHTSCNRSEGARRGNRQRGKKVSVIFARVAARQPMKAKDPASPLIGGAPTEPGGSS